MEYRSPLDNVFNFISGLPQGHDKPVKHAVYNAVALFLLFLCCAAGYALYVILGPFIKPLIWALLVGSVLHPFKSSLAKKFRSWFNNLEKSNTPAFLGLVIVPIDIVNNISEFIGDKLLNHLKIILAVAIVIPVTHIIYYYTPKICICLVWKLGTIGYQLINFTVDSTTVSVILIILMGYLALTFFLWTPENNYKFHLASCAVWLLIACCIAHHFGATFQSLIFVLLQFVLTVGLLYEVYNIYNNSKETGLQLSFLDSFKIAFSSKHREELLKDENEQDDDKEEHFEKIGDDSSVENHQKNFDAFSEETTPVNKKDKEFVEVPQQKNSEAKPSSSEICSNKKIRNLPKVKFQRSYSQPHVTVISKPYVLGRNSDFLKMTGIDKKLEDVEYASDFYLYTLLWMCAFMFFWKNFFLLPVLPIPILIYTVKHIGSYLGLWSWMYDQLNEIFSSVYNWCHLRSDALLPLPVRGLYKVIRLTNGYVDATIKDSIDTVSSCVVIFGLLVFVLCSSIFIAIQVYSEAITLVQMTSNVINQTVVHNPELRQLLPPSFDDTVDSILNNAYQYGREGISKAVRGIMVDVDSEKSVKLEQQVLELWDRVYQKWMSTDTVHGPTVTSAAVLTTWKAFVEDIQKSPELFNLNNITEFVKQNIGTFMSLLDSVWSILKGNASLVLGSCSAFISVLLGGGTAVLNFILNIIVFLTTLFYLLSSSGDLYKPVEFMTNLSPSGSRFGLALEGAVNGVFAASFKMAFFYGMWTWFIHNLFNVQIVYLPSAFATILGAVPFLGTYWAGVPAVLDLWLAQGKSLQAILFAICQFLPTSIVDTTIYNEIQGGGHPYLTGLAIAGGIFCLGVEGAIIGPLLLCGLYVFVDLSSSLFKESPMEESINIPNLSRLEFSNT